MTRFDERNEPVHDKTAIRLAEKAERQPLTPGELVTWSRAIQLGSEHALPLDQAERALRSALEIDGEYVPALLDLGHFLYAVMDDAQAALPFFERAEAVSREALEEAREGLARCRHELDEDDLGKSPGP